MCKSKLSKLRACAFTAFCLTFISLSTQAANEPVKAQPDKARLALMPLQADGFEQDLLDRMASALARGFAQQYELVSVDPVAQPKKKRSNKKSPGARNRECDDMACLKKAALQHQAKIYAAVHVVKAAEGYMLTLDIRVLATDRAVSYIALMCRSCEPAQVVGRLEELGAAPATNASQPLRTGDVFRDCADCPEMVAIPDGDFDMGAVNSGEADEQPEHRVFIGHRFAMGRIEITRGQFAEFVRASGHHADADDKCWMLADDKWDASGSISWRNPGYVQDDSHPVACINWIDAQAYVQWLALKTGKLYQLPTEAEWEYACRSGSHANYCGSDDVKNVAWYDKNSGSATHPAAAKNANVFGLYDMSGNVGEWVEDSYHKHYAGAPTDGSAWLEDHSRRVLRGGSWLCPEGKVRSAFRSVSSPEYRYVDSGFRVVRTLP